MTADKVLAALEGMGGKVMRTSFDDTKQEALQTALTGRAAAATACNAEEDGAERPCRLKNVARPAPNPKPPLRYGFVTHRILQPPGASVRRPPHPGERSRNRRAAGAG